MSSRDLLWRVPAGAADWWAKGLPFALRYAITGVALTAERDLVWIEEVSGGGRDPDQMGFHGEDFGGGSTKVLGPVPSDLLQKVAWSVGARMAPIDQPTIGLQGWSPGAKCAEALLRVVRHARGIPEEVPGE